MGWYKKQRNKKYLQIIFNCLCPVCKKYQAERIDYQGIGCLGLSCVCGAKEKADLNKINYYMKSFF